MTAAPPRTKTRVSVARVALWVLALFIVMIPADSGIAIPGVGSLSRAIGVLALLVGLFSVVAMGRVRLRRPSLFLVIIALFALWSAATFFWSIAPGTTIGRVNTIAQLAIMAWLLHQFVRDDRDLDFVWQAFVVGCFIMVGTGLAAFLGGAQDGFRDVGGRNPNGFAIVAALGIPMAWGLAMRSTRGWLRFVNALYPLFAVVGVVLAASRGGLLTAIVALAIIPLTMGTGSAFIRGLAFVFIAGGIVATFTAAPTAFPSVQRNVERLAETDEQLFGGTLTGRTRIWSAGIEVFASSPVVGIGAGGFNTAVLPLLGEARSPHNAFLSVAVGAGLVGLGLFLAIVLIPGWSGVARPHRRIEHGVLFLALLVAMIPTNSDNDRFVWFILGAIAAARPVYMANVNRGPTLTVEHDGSVGVPALGASASSARAPVAERFGSGR